MPDCRCSQHHLIRRGKLFNVIPAIKTHEQERRYSHKAFQHGHGLDVWTYVRLELLRRGPGCGKTARHILRDRQKMKIVTVVHRGIQTVGPVRLHVCFIHPRRVFVT